MKYCTPVSRAFPVVNTFHLSQRANTATCFSIHILSRPYGFVDFLPSSVSIYSGHAPFRSAPLLLTEYAVLLPKCALCFFLLRDESSRDRRLNLSAVIYLRPCDYHSLQQAIMSRMPPVTRIISSRILVLALALYRALSCSAVFIKRTFLKFCQRF